MSDIQLPNPNLSKLESDFAYHLGIPLDEETASIFSNVKFVCIGGTRGRMRNTCVHIAREVYDKDIEQDDPFDYFFQNDRYSGYKTGALLCVSHGMGMPSLSIMLHEVFKLLNCARCRDVTIIRIGTCGGVGIPGGTIVITEESVTTGLQPVYNTSMFGCPLALPAKSDVNVINELKSLASTQDALKDYTVISAKTYCTEDFYQGQGRLDGSFCDKTEQDKEAFLAKLYDHGVRNIEMESAAVLALTHKIGVRAAVVCVTLLDRFKSDLVTASSDQQQDWIHRPIRLVTAYIQSKLQQPNNHS